MEPAPVFFRDGAVLKMRRAPEAEPVPVTLVWPRPISARGADIAVLDSEGKELLLLHSLDETDADSRACIEEELRRRYLICRITRVMAITVQFHDWYWEVETDRGPRQFAMKDPHANTIWNSDDHVIFRDTLGNRYEIPSLRALDPVSRAQVQRMI